MNYSNEAPPAPEPTIPDTGKIISRLGLVLGLFVIMVGLSLLSWKKYQLSTMQTVEGVAVAYEKGVPGMSGEWPHVRYSIDGQDYVASGKVHSESGGKGVKKGDSVTIYYPADAPAAGQVGLFIELWFAPLLVSAVGLGFFVIAYLLGR